MVDRADPDVGAHGQEPPGGDPTPGVLVVDAANVVGSRPDGWWRDRAGAASRLVTSVRAAVVAGVLAGPVTVVLEGRARPGAPEGEEAGVAVVHATGEGDDRIVDEAADAIASGAGPVRVVTADRGLAARVEALGAEVLGPRWLLTRLDP